MPQRCSIHDAEPESPVEAQVGDASVGQFRLVNVARNRCLDLSNGGSTHGTKVQGWSCVSTTDSQRWRPVWHWPHRTATFLHWWSLTNADNGKCPDLAGGNMNDGALVQAMDLCGTGLELGSGQPGLGDPFVTLIHSDLELEAYFVCATPTSAGDVSS